MSETTGVEFSTSQTAFFAERGGGVAIMCVPNTGVFGDMKKAFYANIQFSSDTAPLPPHVFDRVVDNLADALKRHFRDNVYPKVMEDFNGRP